MFGCSSEAVMANISDSISACSSILPFLDGTIGEQANGSVNRLISTKTKSEMERLSKENLLVSRYAASELALVFGPNLV